MLKIEYFLVVLLFSCILSCEQPPPPDDPTEITMENFQFNPQVFTAKAGEIVTWVHRQPGILHTVTSDDGRLFDSRGNDPNRRMREGDEFEFLFEAGSYPYRCVVHGVNMTGTIEVIE